MLSGVSWKVLAHFAMMAWFILLEFLLSVRFSLATFAAISEAFGAEGATNGAASPEADGSFPVCPAWGTPFLALNMALLLQMAVNAGMLVMDIVAMWTLGIGVISFGGIVCCILAAAAAFAGVFLGIKAMRMLAVHIGFNIFAFYSLGVALFSFILFLTA